MKKIVQFLRYCNPAKTVIITIMVLLAFVPVVQSQESSSYPTYDQLTSEIKKLVNANKNIAKMESIGKTLEGRDLWIVTIANTNGVPVDERPGMFIGANFEGDHLVGSQLSLSLINYLLTNYSSDEEVKKSIDEHVYYIIPRMNPDGAEKMFATVKTGSKTNTFPYDGDNDGRMDEDGPEDLNNDGRITMMRVKDENGIYTTVDDEARLLKKADPQKGESGVYSVYWEGIDNDGDGYINEDPVGGVDINRNFMHEYPYYQDDAGWYMVSEKESVALMEWIIKHRNIAIMLNFGESDNLIVSPDQKGLLKSDKEIDLISFADESISESGTVGIMNTGGGRFAGSYRQGQSTAGNTGGRPNNSNGPATTVNTNDIVYFTKAGEKYRELTKIKMQPPIRDPKGAFFQYGYYQFGVLSLSTPGWGIEVIKDTTATEGEHAAATGRGGGGGRPTAAGMQGPGDQQKQGIDQTFLSWLDSNNENGFVDWETIDHPEFGEVEVGGFSLYDVSNPPASAIDSLGIAHGKFAVWLSCLYANVKIASTEVSDFGGGIFRIKAEVENTGFLPTSLSHGLTSRSVKPTMVQLDVDSEAIISGNAKTSFFQVLAGSGNREKYEWLIKGEPGDEVELKVVAQKAGTDSVTITLK